MQGAAAAPPLLDGQKVVSVPVPSTHVLATARALKDPGNDLVRAPVPLPASSTALRCAPGTRALTVVSRLACQGLHASIMDGGWGWGRGCKHKVTGFKGPPEGCQTVAMRGGGLAMAGTGQRQHALQRKQGSKQEGDQGREVEAGS